MHYVGYSSYRESTMEHKSRTMRVFGFSPLVATIVLLLGAACGGSSDEPGEAGPPTDAASQTPPSASPTDELTIIQPGRPGEGALTGGPVPTIGGDPNQADITFVQVMVPHHAQAVEMSELAHRHATDPGVRRLAARIRAAQGPEILMMSAWLEEQGLPGTPEGGHHAEHGAGTMAGMLTPVQMDALAAARGRAFDRLFLEGMLAHHQGALRMAETVARQGIDIRVGELAADIHLTQNAEIARMRDLLG